MARADSDESTILMLCAGIGAWLAWRAYQNSQAATFPTFGPGAPSNVVQNVISQFVPMSVSANGLAFIKANEGYTSTPKADAGHQVIGWGHDILPGENFAGGITQAQAQQLFDADIAKVESALNSTIKVPVSQNQFDALADWTFNVGVGAMQGSTLIKQLNAGNYAAAAADFDAWVISSGTVNTRLQKRRTADASLFNLA